MTESEPTVAERARGEGREDTSGEPVQSGGGAAVASSDPDGRSEEAGRQDTVKAMPGGTLLGMCLGGQHATLRARTRVRWREPDESRPREAWLPTLQGLTLRKGDRVLLTRPGNHDEPVVLGVLDGLRARDDGPPADAGPLLELGPDEAVRVASSDGTPMLEVRATVDGPRIRLLVGSAEVSMPGTFRVSADDVELEARKGEVRIDAAGDVKVAGEIVRLN